MRKRIICLILALTLIAGWFSLQLIFPPSPRENRIAIMPTSGIFVIQRTLSGRRNYEVAVSQPETAVAIAIAILNEHFPRNQYEAINFQAEENNGIWVVQRIALPPLGIVDGEVFIRLGHTRYVHIRKSNGEILRIGLR